MERAAASRTKPRSRRGLVIAALIPPALGLWFWLSRDEVIAPAPVATSTMRTESPVPAVDVARTSESEDVNEPVAVAENEAVAVAVEQDASLPAEVAPQVPRRRAIAVRSQPSAIGPRAYVGPFHVSDFGGRR